MSEQPGRYQRSTSGLIGALVVLLLVIGAFITFRALNREAPADPVVEVDYRTPARFARGEASFRVLVPTTLPTGWKATSVRFGRFQDTDQQAWHLGCLTDQQRYVGLEQVERGSSSGPADRSDLVHEFVDEEARQGDDVRIDGDTWSTFSDPQRDPDADPSTAGEGDLALVHQDAKATTLVVGTVPGDVLASYVASLRA